MADTITRKMTELQELIEDYLTNGDVDSMKSLISSSYRLMRDPDGLLSSEVVLCIERAFRNMKGSR